MHILYAHSDFGLSNTVRNHQARVRTLQSDPATNTLSGISMPFCYYTCNLLPLELVVRRGYAPRWLGRHLRDPNSPVRRDALSVHPMTCPYVTKLVAAADELLGATSGCGAAEGGDSLAAETDLRDRLVVPAGCDAMRRLGDLLKATYPKRVFVVPMPRSSGAEVQKRLAEDLKQLDEWLVSQAAAEAGTPAALRSPVDDGTPTASQPAAEAGMPTTDAHPEAQPSDDAGPGVDYPAAPRPGGVFVVAGPLTDDSLLRLIIQLGSTVAALESCTSPDRWRPLAAAAPERLAGLPDPDFDALAAAALETGMCPRRSTADRRAYLLRRLDEARPSSVIYARQSFCDPGAYDALLVAHLAAERRLPYLEIEVDFPFDANGPLRTRVEAFLEAQSLDEDLLSGGQAIPRNTVPAAAACGDCPNSGADEPRVSVPDDDLSDDLFGEEE